MSAEASGGIGAPAGTRSHLFKPLALRGLTLKNRVVVAPMAMYAAADGHMSDFHLVHLGRFALGGAGLVVTEAVAVARDGRITPGCAGIWSDAHVEGLARIASFLRGHGAAAGIQLNHAGMKGSSQPPWEGGAPLVDGAWSTVGPTSRPFDKGWPAPAALDEAGLDGIVTAFAEAARRAVKAGFDVVELHCAHGYLLNSFLSPISNTRNDAYGGSREGRMRFPLRVVEAVREVWPSDKPVLVRISAVDGVDVGWSIADSVALASELRARGVDAVDCSTGGVRVDRAHQVPAREAGFQVPYAAAVRAGAGIPTVAVGLIRDPHHADELVRDGKCDLVALAREMLVDPNWAAHAAVVLEGAAGWKAWPERFGFWLERRARLWAPKPDKKAG